jgi:DNA-binding MarR family transcriptional regulator
MVDASSARRLWEQLLALRRRLLDGMSDGLPALAALELTVPQSMVLFYLVEKGPRTITELRKVAGRSQAATSHLVAAMEKRGLVKRRSDEADARRTVVHAAPKALKLVAQVENMRLRSLEAALDQVSERTVKRLDDALAALLSEMEKQQ